MAHSRRGPPLLEANLVFPEAFDSDAAWKLASSGAQLSLTAYDGAGRLFVWNPEGGVLHTVSVERDGMTGRLASLHSGAHSAPFDTLVPTAAVDFHVLSIAVNRSGRYVALVGESALAVLDALSVMGTDSPEVGFCSVHSVAGGIFQGGESSPLLLRVAWHSNSDTHLGCLSSDGQFRLVNLSEDKDTPEQEYYLQRRPAQRGSFVRPVDFVFGGDHLWEPYTVFFLWSDGSIWPLCPIVPFGSLISHESVSCLVWDTEQAAAQDSACDTEATLAWLHATFPLHDHHQAATSASPDRSEAVRAATGMMVKARAHAPFHCSPALQGPLPLLGSEAPPLGKGVRACHLVCSTSGKDSLVGWSQSDGFVHVGVLSEEVLPAWSYDHVPQTTRDSEGRLLSVTMVASSTDVAPRDSPAAPPLLLLASVDLALPPDVKARAPLSLLADPLVPERLFCRHGGGVDALTLQWLPFSDSAGGTRDLAHIPSPATSSVLDTKWGDAAAPRPLLGLAVVSDSAGETWLVASPVGGECMVVPVKGQAPAVVPPLSTPAPEDSADQVPALSAQLAQGPRNMAIPKSLQNGAALSLSSHEGRLFLHDHVRLLRDGYIAYAHHCHVELRARAVRLGEMVREQEAQLEGARKELGRAAKRSAAMDDRRAAALAKHEELEGRLQRYSQLPVVSRTPLTAAERAYRTEMVTLEAGLPLLGTTLSELTERARRLVGAHQNRGSRGPKTPPVPDAQMHRLKQAVERSTEAIESMMDKVRLCEESVHRKERNAGR